MRRNTVQRRAIREVFGGAGRPLSPAEVHAAAMRVVPSLGLATVYRAVNDLLREGWLTVVALPNEGARYERAGKPHHHHFRCRCCHRVFDVDGCPGAMAGLVPAGFQLEDHEVVLYGRCTGCAA